MTFPPMRRLMLVGVVAVLAASVVVACAPARDDSAMLGGQVWRATELRVAQGLVPVPSTGGPTSEFSADRVSGTTGVNLYNGQFTTGSGDSIKIQLGPMTLMAGPPAAMELETAFVQALKSATRYSVTQTELRLLDDSGNVLVSYAVLKPTPLVDTEWNCVMYNNGRGALQSLVASSVITAVFAGDDSLSGTGGVNNYSGKYTAQSGAMTIDPAIVTTRMAGPADVMAQEAAYLAALPKATTYKIEGKQLTLRDPGGAAIAQYEVK